MNRQPRLIVVMRHAKAEQLGPTDLERELSPRGSEDPAAMGRWLGEQQITPDDKGPALAGVQRDRDS